MFMNAFADHQLSDLHIRKFDNQPVLVQLNFDYFDNPGPVTKINNLQPGRYRIKVWSLKNQAFHPHNNNNNKRLLYNGFIDVPAGSEVRAILTKNNTMRINQVIPNFIPQPVNPYFNPNVAPCPGPVVYNAPQHIMSPSEFNALLNTIDNQSFESTKLMIAKQAINQHQFISTAQVSALINSFSFESSKLDLAKYAYQYTIDRNNYFHLYNNFTFDSSVRSLGEYIDRFS